ncbi:MAG TPA: aspartate/glutamate racemase family protein [Candidatus Paceibacterota bacterium]|nr:aspartate/glutamate racemase family protein [Candidatus Paceibacterota bacterium]
MIGIFDSGSGGLTVLRAIRNVLPSCDVLYFGDIKHAPYGSKSREELSNLTIDAIKLLYDRGARNIVSACNSVSASLAVSLLDASDIAPTHLIEMVGPTVAYFKGSGARILLCATPATIESTIYQSAFRMIGKNITTVAISELAGAIEFAKSREEIQKILTEAFANISLADFDVLILGCTHYPLVLDLFTQVLPKTIAVFDPALAVAERVERQFWPQEAGDAITQFVISKDSEPFRTFAAKLFPGQKYTVEVIE